MLGEFGYENVLSIDSEEDGDGDNAGNDDNSNNNHNDDGIPDDDVPADDDPVGNDDETKGSDANELKPGDKPPYVPQDDDSMKNENAMGRGGDIDGQSSKQKKKGGKGPLLFFGLILMGGVTVYVISSDGRYSTMFNRVGIGGGGYHQVTQQQSLSGEDGALEVELSLAKFYRRLAGGETNAAGLS